MPRLVAGLALAAAVLAVLALLPDGWARAGLWFLAGSCAGAAAALLSRDGAGTATGLAAGGEASATPAGLPDPKFAAGEALPDVEPDPPDLRSGGDGDTPRPPAESHEADSGPPQAAPSGGGLADHWADARRSDGIGYIENRPAWFVRVVHPARFKQVEHDVEFRLFLFPTSALVAVLLRFFDNPKNPYCFHRVFDLSDSPTLAYLRRVSGDGHWTVVVNGRGTEQGFNQEVGISPGGLPRCIQEGERHVRALRMVDGSKAVESFFKVFKTESTKSGFHAGWEAVYASLRQAS